MRKLWKTKTIEDISPLQKPSSSYGQSLLFLIVVATFMLLLSSSLIYSITIKGTLKKQSSEMAISEVLSVLALVYPVINGMVDQVSDPQLILSDFCISLSKNNPSELADPFIMKTPDFEIPIGIVPAELSMLITSKFKSGGIAARQINSISQAAWITTLHHNERIWLAAAAPLKQSDYMLGLVQDITPYLLHAEKVERILIGSLALGYVFFLSLLVLVLKIITDPLKNLIKAAQKFSQGDFDQRVSVPKMVTEVRVLAETFNKLGVDLKTHRNSLEAYSRDLEEANRQRGKAMEELKRRSHELERINRISRTISGELDMDRLLIDVVEFTQQTIHAECVLIGILDQRTLQTHYVFPNSIEINPSEMNGESNRLMADLLSSTGPVLIDDLTNYEGIQPDSFIRLNNFRSFIGIPIIRKGILTGLLCGFSKNPSAFSSNDSYFIELLASQVAIALDNARLFEEIMARDSRRDMQLSMAQKLQKARTPEYFKQNVVAFNCRLKPADELAGDFYDVFSLGKNSVAVVIGDVANKGVAASLMTFSLLSMFRNVAKTHKPPCDLMKAINKSLLSQIKEEGWFATAFYARLNTSTGVLTYTSAGHEMPLWFHADTGEVETLDATGLPLGLFYDIDFETREIQLKTGDRLILYTDGITDAVNSEGTRLGHETLIHLTRRYASLPFADFIDKIVSEVQSYIGSEKQRDDIIVAVLEMQDDPWIHKTIHFRESAALINEIMQGLVPYNLDNKLIYSIRLAVDEAISNAWRHGCSERDDALFNVSYLISDEGFQLRVKDSGAGFDHESLPDPTVEENLLKSHGRGVFLIRQVMDEVEFNDVGNEITIRRAFPPTSESEEILDSSSLFDSFPALIQQQRSLDKAKNAENDSQIRSNSHVGS